MANEVFARVKIAQLMKDAELAPTAVRSARFEYPPDDECKADFAPRCCQGGAPNALETKRSCVNLSVEETQWKIAQLESK